MRELSVKEVQTRLLEMGKTICAILEAHDIPYIINFGTLLGAVRHGGFIPWDDDFDISIPAEAYDGAIEALRTALPDDMFLEDAMSEPKYFHAWAHVKDMGTVADCEQYPQDNIYDHKGVSVDIYNYFPMDESEVDLFRLKENLAYQRRKAKLGLLAREAFLAAEETLLARIAEEEVRAAAAEKVRPAYAMMLNERIMYPEEVLPRKRYRFEDTEFYGPNDPDALLTRYYGDHMRLPPKEERVPHFSRVLGQ